MELTEVQRAVLRELLDLQRVWTRAWEWTDEELDALAFFRAMAGVEGT